VPLFRRKPTARQLLAQARHWRYESTTTVTFGPHLARHLDRPADRPVAVTDFVSGHQDGYDIVVYTVDAATVWCVYLPVSYPSMLLSAAEALTAEEREPPALADYVGDAIRLALGPPQSPLPGQGHGGVDAKQLAAHTSNPGFARLMLTPRVRALIATLPTTAGALENDQLWISTIDDTDTYRTQLDQVLEVLTRLLDLTDAVPWFPPLTSVSKPRPQLPDDQVAELRAKYMANSERVQRFFATWDIPEVVWDPFAAAPAVEDALDVDSWAPHLDQYRWMRHGEPRVDGLFSVVAEWRFTTVHQFEALFLRIECLCDPDYLAEKLAYAANAAAFPGWQPSDTAAVHKWFRNMTDMQPHQDSVGGYHRSRFVLFDLDRFPGATQGVIVTVKITLTDKVLDGTALDSGGVMSRGD
jgi:hypothetical protein